MIGNGFLCVGKFPMHSLLDDLPEQVSYKCKGEFTYG